jgi:hypothetical protein
MLGAMERQVCLAVVRALGSRLMMRDEWHRHREPVVRAMYSRKNFSLEACLGDSSTFREDKMVCRAVLCLSVVIPIS